MKEAALLQHLKDNPFVLAPMAGITDKPFRTFMRKQGCGVVVTELVSATGLKYSSQKTRQLMEFDSSQHPVGIQIFGDELEHLRDAAKEVEQMGADFVDINFGCPVPKVVSKGAGSACLKDLKKLGEVIRATKSGVGIPVTIKIRTGWDHETRNSSEVVRIAKEEGVTWVAIHGRTRAAGYTGRADWDYIKEVKAGSALPIIGNGDIVSAKMAIERIQQSHCDAVMIGRGCLKNPLIFREALELLKASGATVTKDMYQLLSDLVVHLDDFYEDRMTMLQVKKFASWYSAGYPSSAQFRRQLFQLKERSEVMSAIEEFCGGIQELTQEDTSQEPFLMGGHG